MARPSFKINAQHLDPDLASEVPDRIAFRSTDPTYADLLVQHATQQFSRLPTAQVASVPGINIGNVSVTAPPSGTTTTALFTIALSARSAQTVTVAYHTADGTALAGTDYVAASGQLTFTSGETQKTISITILHGALAPASATFSVLLTNPVNAYLDTGQATGTIVQPSAGPPPGPVTFTKTDDWGSGFVASMTIRNTGTTTMSNWTLEFDLATDITDIWNSVIVSHVGTHYVIQGAAWDTIIGPGEPITFGFQGTPGLGTTTPTNVKLNGVAV
jgi:chitinase